MKLSELIKAYAADLEDPNNEAILLSEDSDESMEVVAKALVSAAAILYKAAEQIETTELVDDTLITPERLDEMAAVAQAFDESGDELLQKQASVIDEILLTFGAPKDAKQISVAREGQRIEELKKKYKDTKESLQKNEKVSESLKAIKDSQYYKKYQPLEAPLNSRYCPDHPGVQIQRIGEHEYQCELDKATYNWEEGYKLLSGATVPGTTINNQVTQVVIDPNASFDTRESRLGEIYNR